jgi:hypothetical protein
MQPQRKTGLPRRNIKQGRNGTSGTSQPQPVRATLQVDQIVRFAITAALSGQQVTDAELMDLLVVATAATTTTQLAAALKIRAVELWVDPVAGGSFASLEDLSTGSIGGPSRIISDTTLGVTRPAHIMWKPKPGSQQFMWLSPAQVATKSWFELNTSGKGYIDLHLSWLLQDGETPVSGGSVSAATVGQIYIRALDSGTGSTLIIPVSFPTIS